MSIFKIEQDLENILLEVENYAEENEGEVSEELLENLTIAQDNLEEKLIQYRQAISKYNSDILLAKEERNRLHNIKKIRENRVSYLKNVIKDAVIKYGRSGKSGNKTIELSDSKFYTRNSNVIIPNQVRLEFLKSAFLDYTKELYKNGLLCTRDGVDLSGMLFAMNEILSAYVENFIPFTEDDLSLAVLNITTIISIKDIMNHDYLLSAIFESESSNYTCGIDISIDKPVVKRAIENDALVTICKSEFTSSVIIK